MLNTRRTRYIPGLAALALAAAACGGAVAPSTELLTARQAYDQARSGEAARLNPTGVHEAAKAMQAAEGAHKDDAGSQREKNYAYIALRKSEIAIAGASEALRSRSSSAPARPIRPSSSSTRSKPSSSAANLLSS